MNYTTLAEKEARVRRITTVLLGIRKRAKGQNVHEQELLNKLQEVLKQRIKWIHTHWF